MFTKKEVGRNDFPAISPLHPNLHRLFRPRIRTTQEKEEEEMKFASLGLVLTILFSIEGITLYSIWNIPWLFNQLYITTTRNIIQPIDVLSLFLLFTMMVEIGAVIFICALEMGKHESKTKQT